MALCKHLYIIMVSFFLNCPIIGMAQSGNYVKTNDYLDETGHRYVSSVQCYDGLGRPSISATNGHSGRGVYSYSLQEYDSLGRESRLWKPIPGSIEMNIPSQTDFLVSQDIYQYDSCAYSFIEYDALGRKTNTCRGGQSWYSNEKNSTISYTSNTSSEVIRYTINPDGNSLDESEYWPAASLTKETITDEDGLVKSIYKNFLGEVIMEDYAGSRTYYVYNSIGLLSFVLTPLYQSSRDINLYAYKYEYDGLGRLIGKKQPGCASTTYVYDNMDRAVITQDPLLREKGLYRFMMYDHLGRVAIQGTTTAYDESQLNNFIVLTETEFMQGTLNTGYCFSQSLFPDGINIEIINYYDNHDFLSNSAFSNCSCIDELTNQNYNSTQGENVNFSTGFLTGQIVSTSNNNLLYNTFYHNQNGLVVDERHTTIDGYVLKKITDYSFTNKPTLVTEIFRSDITITTEYTYNLYNNQLQTTNIRFGENEDNHIVSLLEYDDLGRIHNDTRTDINDIITYDYNLHGWTKDIIGNFFTEHLHYIDGNENPCFNGNISSQEWIASDDSLRVYTFSYNNKGMLKDAIYNNISAVDEHYGRYDEKTIAYNANGAITRIYRNGLKNNGTYGFIDLLSYNYHGNQVRKISDTMPSKLSYENAFEYQNNNKTGDDFEYNSAGMLIKDKDKGIDRIVYNNIGLVDSIVFDSGAKVVYTYAMNGEKLRVRHFVAPSSVAGTRFVATSNTASATSLSNNIIPAYKEEKYIGNSLTVSNTYPRNNREVSQYKYNFETGYLRFSTSPNSSNSPFVPQYYYYSKDHLGNIRSVVTKNPTDNSIQEVQRTHYYPFGGIIADISTGRDVQNRLYNGKELDASNNLWWYDYGARQYDPTAPRFTSPDPLAEKYYSWNMYGYCMNNPIRYIDPDGKACGDPPGNIISGFFNGVLDAVKESADAVLHIDQTVTNVANAVCHPVETFDNTSAYIKDDYNKFTSGDAVTQSGMVGKLVGDIAIGYLGGSVAKATSKAAKAVSNGSKIARNSKVIGTGTEAVSKHIGVDGVRELDNFSGRVSVIKTTDNVTMSRYYGGNAAPIGRYLSNGAINTTIDRFGLAILPKWGNTMTGTSRISVPAGTYMIKGTAGSQGFPYLGGRTQYYVPSASNLKIIK